MTKRGIWPVRAMYTLVAVALVISLMITAAPPSTVLADAHNDVKAEWDRVDTPTTEGWVLAPGSTIIDYALDEMGEVAYAVVWSHFDCDGEPINGPDNGFFPAANGGSYYLLKSDDHAATWTDITGNLEALLGDDDYIDLILHVATDWKHGDFVAVALWVDWYDDDYQLHVFFSTDGGDTFIDARDIDIDEVADLAVSLPDADGKRDIAIGGTYYDGADYLSALFRCVVTGDSAAAWQDATDFDGWDDQGPPPRPTAFNSDWVTDIIFSPSWATDRTILVTTIAATGASSNGGPRYDVHLQSGSWGTTAGTQKWNKDSTLDIDAVPVMTDVYLPTWLAEWDARAIAGITLPSNYNSRNPAQRLLWVWVNYYDEDGYSANQIMRVDDDTADPIGPLGEVQQGKIWLTNISYQGTIESGKALAGVLGTGRIGPEGGNPWELLTEPCQGVQVYRHDGINNMDICCERWKPACKPPTGNAAMAVSYVGGDKAYAVALNGFGWLDEGAWSWTFDDGYNWNQLSLIDTWIDYLSDVAVSPDCNKTMLVSINHPWMKNGYDVGAQGRGGYCDSVWLHAVNLPEATEYSGHWIRTFSIDLTGHGWNWNEHGLLRLAPEEVHSKTVYLVDVGTNKVYRETLEGLGCWVQGTAPTGFEIVDLAVKNATTIYALSTDGKVTEGIADQFAITFSTPVDSKVKYGFTIAAWGDELLVGGQDGDVAHSPHGTGNFTALPRKIDGGNGWITVAFDSYYGANSVIYAAQYKDDHTGDIYMWKAGESTSWINLLARPSTFELTGAGSKTDSHEVAYTGLVLDRPSPGNPKTGPATGGVLYASYIVYHDGYYYTGVARSLTPLMQVDDCAMCPVEWDYLWVGLTPDEEGFLAMPRALKMCGCLTADSYTRLFAIDWLTHHGYDMCEGQDGTVWTFIDCYSKVGVDLRNPADGSMAPSDPCAGCWNAPFSLNWDRVCDACVYEYQFATDAAFEYVVYMVEDVVGSPAHNPTTLVPGGILQPGETYYWRVRARQAGTGQWIRSWWSDARSVTIAPALGTGVYLVAPGIGATGQPRTGIAFVWDSVSAFDSYNFVLSRNADFSAPDATANGLTTKAYTYTGANLAYDTPYYWRVTAIIDGAPASMALGTFRTRPEAPAPVVPEPITTPFWVWVIIAIGAVLVIVVIVLIFRTRRV